MSNDKVAVYSNGGVFSETLGRLDNGYNIVDAETADSWMKITKKVRLATPQEVAAAYGV